MAKSNVPKDADSSEVSFETALAELEKLVATMETGQLPLEESLVTYKRGVELLQHCQRQLADAEERVRVLDAGILKTFDSGDAS
ncbi:MAG: exodeoxyribonuclease VII small subunit [Rhodocyclaceae bacterium]|nr:exodeoxyribonuclease VII small subunit [Rhodocyclaceae bacterium]